MDLRTKFDYLKTHIWGISRHDDEEVDVRSHFLDMAASLIEEEKASMRARNEARIKELLEPRE